MDCSSVHIRNIDLVVSKLQVSRATVEFGKAENLLLIKFFGSDNDNIKSFFDVEVQLLQKFRNFFKDQAVVSEVNFFQPVFIIFVEAMLEHLHLPTDFSISATV